MPTSTGARSLAAATTRLRRAGRVPAPVRLPVALTGSRLAPLDGPTDVDREVADALHRLAVARGGESAPTDPPRAVAGRPTPLPYAVSPRGAPARRAAVAASQTEAAVDEIERGTTGWSGPAPRPGRMAETTLAGSGATPGTPADDVVAPPQSLRRPAALPTAAATGAVTSDAGGPALRHVGSVEPRPPAHAGATAVRVTASEETADLLRRLVAPEQTAAEGAPTTGPAPLPPTRSPSTLDASSPMPRATTPGSLGAPPAPGSVPLLPPAPVGFAAAEAWPAPAAAPDLLAAAPVGLAGLVGWWEGHSRPAANHRSHAGDPVQGRDETAYGPESFEPWTTSGSPSRDELRDALGQLLLEEALADGLEVDDGPA